MKKLNKNEKKQKRIQTRAFEKRNPDSTLAAVRARRDSAM